MAEAAHHGSLPQRHRVGPGVYGIEAAARHHFHKPAAQLSAREAARLLSILPSPLKWRAAQPGPFVRRKARRVQRWARVMPVEFTQCVDGAHKS
nr:transglycosylase domain-containing protein [Hankyongella ginsenosidimutans]